MVNENVKRDRSMPLVTITLDKERHLKYGLKSLKAIEMKTGKSALTNEFWAVPSATNFSILLWAGLLHEDPKLTLEQVDELVDTYSSLDALYSSIAEAWGASMPEPSSEGEKSESPLSTG